MREEHRASRVPLKHKEKHLFWKIWITGAVKQETRTFYLPFPAGFMEAADVKILNSGVGWNREETKQSWLLLAVEALRFCLPAAEMDDFNTILTPRR